MRMNRFYDPWDQGVAYVGVAGGRITGHVAGLGDLVQTRMQNGGSTVPFRTVGCGCGNICDSQGNVTAQTGVYCGPTVPLKANGSGGMPTIGPLPFHPVDLFMDPTRRPLTPTPKPPDTTPVTAGLSNLPVWAYALAAVGLYYAFGK